MIFYYILWWNFIIVLIIFCVKNLECDIEIKLIFLNDYSWFREVKIRKGKKLKSIVYVIIIVDLENVKI